MFKKILLAYDGSPHTAAALRQSAELARVCNAELHLLGVVTLAADAVSASAAMAGAFGPMDLFGMERQSVEKALEAAIDELGDRLSVHTRIREGDPAREIAAHAHEVGADLAVIGHSGKGFMARFFEGSTGASLINNLPCNLMVATSSS